MHTRSDGPSNSPLLSSRKEPKVRVPEAAELSLPWLFNDGGVLLQPVRRRHPTRPSKAIRQLKHEHRKQANTDPASLTLREFNGNLVLLRATDRGQIRNGIYFSILPKYMLLMGGDKSFCRENVDAFQALKAKIFLISFALLLAILVSTRW